MKKIYLILILVAVTITSYLTSCKKGGTFCKIIRTYSTDSFNRTDFIYTGNLITRVNYVLKTGASQGSTIWHYSSTNKQTGFEDLDSNGVILRKTEYFFDGEDRVISEKYYVKSGASLPLSANYSYEYYPNGNLKKYTRFDNGTTVLETTFYLDYDANGNNTKGYHKNNLDVTVDTFFYTYDMHPNFQAQFFFPNNLAKNNALSYTIKRTVGSVFTDTYVYNYNSQGYVIYQKETFDGEETFVDYDCN